MNHNYNSGSSFKYPQNLRQRLIEYFYQTRSVFITHAQADQYLDQLADFYEWLERNHKP
jgi:hypothetical protein